MDDLDAPQWADFTAPSPQISMDDYFFKKNEYRDKFDSADTESPNVSNKSHQFKQPLSESSYINESIMQKTPKRSMISKGNKSSNSQKGKIRQTTYENLLTEAMSNLQLSMKKHPNEKSFNKSCLVDSPAFKTPIKRVTRSMCAQAMNTPKQLLEESCHEKSTHEKSLHEKSKYEKSLHEKSVRFMDIEPVPYEENEENSKEVEHEEPMNLTKNEEPLDLTKHEDIKEDFVNLNNVEPESPATDQSSQINLEVTASSTEHEMSHEKLESEHEKELLKEKFNKSEQLPKSRVVTSFGTKQKQLITAAKDNNTKKRPTTLTGTAWHRQVKRRMSLTNQRRVSIVKSQAPGKYVSMAEAVSKFQRTTPQRFHSKNIKTTRIEQLRRMSFKLTRAHSPALMCKNRIRPVTALSREEQERIELEKIRQNQIKANPIPKDILKKPAPLKKVEKKMLTNPEPFHLTEIKKTQPLPKNQIKTQEIKKVYRAHPRTVNTLLSANETGVLVKEEEVLHFGIPVKPSGNKKDVTKVMPFSFEARNKELVQRKLEKLRALQEQEKQKVKTEFHARPIPIAVKTPMSKIPLKDNSAKKPKITITRSLSFEERVKETQKKKEERIKQMQEEEKKMRTFKAQKVPEFKPVLVRGRSRDNLLKKSMENLSIKPLNISQNKTSEGNLKKTSSLKKPQICPLKKPVSIPFVAPKKTSPSVVSNENQENQIKGSVPKILEPKCKLSQKSVAVLTELNTDKRAKQRKEFDEQLKKKEVVEEEIRKQEEEERIEREKAERLELRKMAEVKARPMPVYKPMTVLRSSKPLTEAQSPAWAKRKGSSTH